MKTAGNIVGTILALGIIAGLGVGAYFAIKFIIHRLAPVRFQVDDVTMTTWLVALLAAFIVAHSVSKLGEQERLKRLHDQKAETYHLFITLWAERLQHPHVADPELQGKMDANMASLDRLLVVCGGPDVVNVHAAMRGLEGHDPELESAFAKALMAIRRDLGLSAFGLKSEALLDLLLAHTERPAVKFDPRPDIQPRISLSSNS
jgi:hypothetical protein